MFFRFVPFHFISFYEFAYTFTFSSLHFAFFVNCHPYFRFIISAVSLLLFNLICSYCLFLYQYSTFPFPKGEEKKFLHLFYIQLIKTEEKTNKGFNSFSNDILRIFRNGGRVSWRLTQTNGLFRSSNKNDDQTKKDRKRNWEIERKLKKKKKQQQTNK